jgi:hypothetical protein
VRSSVFLCFDGPGVLNPFQVLEIVITGIYNSAGISRNDAPAWRIPIACHGDVWGVVRPTVAVRVFMAKNVPWIRV